MKLYPTLLLCGAVGALAAEPPRSIATLDGRKYEQVTIGRIEPDGINISHADGATKLRFTELPEALQKEFGYNPDVASRVAAMQQRRAAQETLHRNKTSAAEARFAKWNAELARIRQHAASSNDPDGAETLAGAEEKMKTMRKAVAAFDVAKIPPATIQQIIDCTLERKVCIGMPDACVLIAWGRPRDINKTTSRSGTSEQWVYADGYVYLDDGIVTTVQQ